MAITENYTLIEVDSSKGGNGDIWMRLIGFYAASALLPQYKFKIQVPAFFKNIAEYTFGDRLIIISKSETKFKYTYTVFGLRDLLGPIIKGNKFIAPYQRAVAHDKKKKQFKDQLNNRLFDFANWVGVVSVPAPEWIESYQGFLEIIGIKEIKSINYEAFAGQMKVDFNNISPKLQSGFPVSPNLKLPKDISQNVVIFPTGTSRQFIPVWWAKLNIPDAYYAFFFKDPEAELFKNAGLKTIFFYEEPGDIIKLAHTAKWAISTDSFPAHLLQCSSNKCTILITEVLSSRIISPAFNGKVVEAEVACHPCLHMNRKTHPLCAEGYAECLNWKNERYTKNILDSVNFDYQ
jgi:hypothetical protein